MIPIGGTDLNRILAVWRPSIVDDGAGGQDVTMVQAGAVRALVSQPTAAERIAAAQAGATHSTVIHMEPTAEVYRGDQLRGDGQAWRVKATLTPSEAAYLRVECEMIEPEPEVGS